MKTQENIHEAIELIEKLTMKAGVDSPLITFLLDHLAEFSDDLAEKFDEEAEE